MTQEGLDLLARALEENVPPALPRLKTLSFHCVLPPRGLAKLARALAGGAAPLLQKFYFDKTECDEDDLDSIAGMLEARANIPGCKGFEYSDGNDGWFDEAPLQIQIRLLRSLLPSVRELPEFLWSSDFEHCFLDVQAPYLTDFNVCFKEDGGVFSWRVLAALSEIERATLAEWDLSATAMPSVTEALRHGALQKLQKVEFYECLVGDGDFKDLMQTLGGLWLFEAVSDFGAQQLRD